MKIEILKRANGVDNKFEHPSLTKESLVVVNGIIMTPYGNDYEFINKNQIRFMNGAIPQSGDSVILINESK